MKFRAALLRQTGLCCLAAVVFGGGAQARTTHHHSRPARAANEEAAQLKQQIGDLESQVQALQSWRDQETRARTQDGDQISDLKQRLAASDARSRAAETTAREQIETIPGAVKSEIAAEKPKDGKVRYKGVSLTVGGFAAAETVYRSRNEEADIGSSFAKIPFASSPLAHTGEFRGTARQSRLSLLAEGDVNPDTHASFYTEIDFLAGPQTGNSNESNSFSPRIRNLYGAVDWDRLGLHLLAGQNWSLATLNSKGITPRNEAPPPTIEAQYVVGFTWARQPQVRLTADFADKQFWLAASLENPQTTFASAATGTTGTAVPGLTVTDVGAPTSQFDSTNTLSFNHAPDVIGKAAFEPNLFGSKPLHVEVYGLYRGYTDRVAVTSSSNVLGLPVGIANRDTGGGGVGWGVSLTAVPRLLDLQFSGLTGRGIGRYGSAQLPDTVVGPDGALKPIPETMYMVGGTLHATRSLDLYVFGGEDSESRVFATNKAGAFGYGSPTATLTGCEIEGGACAPDIHRMSQITGGFWDKIYQGSFGQVRFGFQYSYTELTAFSGAGGVTPKTNDNMFFTSFRYYPF